MAAGLSKIAIVGASSLLGKELAEVLGESVLGTGTLVLLDDEALAGQMTATGDEVALIEGLKADSFAGMDFVFFTGRREVTRQQWKVARQAGAGIIDLTHALADEPNVTVRGPWLEEGFSADARGIDLATQAVVAAHPASLMLALTAGRLRGLGVASVAATVMEPASQHEQAAIDELHQQTVNLLSFQTLPREQHDAQIAFNLLPSLGEAAKIGSTETRQVIEKDYTGMSAGRLASLAVQLVHAPVFYGYVCSTVIDLARPATQGEVEAALAGVHVDLVSEGSDPPSNLSATGQEDILLQVRPAFEGERGTRFWLWMAADNLKLAALNAVACAVELRRLRPRGTVQ